MIMPSSRDTGGFRDAAFGVSDGARTRDPLDHNQVLYLLSYTHHRRGGWNFTAAASVYPPAAPASTAVAMACACSTVGPGGVTNSVPR
jgi:hypothetical protein